MYYPPPPSFVGLVVYGDYCSVGAFASECAQLFMAGVPTFHPPASVHALPPPPQSVSRWSIKNVADDGGHVAPNEEGRRFPKADAGHDPAARARQRPAPPPPSWRREPHRARVPSFRSFDPNADLTSLMIRNVPIKLMKRRFIDILDKHCAEENRKLFAVEKSELDFLYVPVDFKTGRNKGYAFVNMTTPAAARRLHAYLDGHRWEAERSRKVCAVVHADIQGLDAFIAHFSRSVFPCGNEEFLPVRFDPPRDGVRPTSEHVVGRLASPR